jgi:hypothetical protein
MTRMWIGSCIDWSVVLDDIIRVAGFWIGDDLLSRYLRDLDEFYQQPNSCGYTGVL